MRIVHIPTNTVVVCQDDRSLYANKEKGMEYLKEKLLLKQERDIAKEKQIKYSMCEDSTFGHQIRNYVLCGNNIIKDKRSGYESKNIKKILNGDIDDMLKANLMYFHKQKLE